MKKYFLCLLILFLVACGGSDETGTPVAETAVPAADNDTNNNETTNDAETAVSEDSSPEEQDKIIIQMALYDWQSSQYRDLIETFEAENPDIEIKVVSVEETLGLDSNGFGEWPEDAARRLVSAADIVSTNSIGIPSGESGLLLDLRPLAEADPIFDFDDFYPNMLDRFERDGQLLGLPTTANFTLIFFHKDAFDEAGVPYPEPGWSWNDMLAAAQATTIREGDEVVQWGLVQSSSNPFEFVLPRTGNLIDTGTEPPTPNFERPEVIEALQWYADLYLLHEVAPNLEQPEPDEDGSFVPPGYELIENEQAAMWPEWSGSWQWRSSQMNLGVVPFPVDSSDDKTSQMFGDGFSISAGTQSPEAAWRWLNFLSSQPSANDFDDTAVPARISVAEASGFWDDLDPELRTALAYALERAYVPQFSAGYGALGEAAQAILQEGQSVVEAVAAAQIQAETEIAEAGTAGEESDDETEIVVAAPEELDIPEGAITIVFMAGGGPGGLQPYRDLVSTFQETYPNIVIDIQTPDFGPTPIGLADVAADSDCLQWFGSVTNEEDRTAVLPIEPFLDADPELSKADFYQTALDQFSYQGQLWGLPAEMNIPVIVYNKALFDAANVPYPTVDWTTDDFLETAVALTNGDDPETKQYGYMTQEFEINDLTHFLERLGGQFLDESVEPPQLTFTHPATVEAMRWFSSLTTEFGVKPVFITSIGSTSFGFGEERKTLIENGRAAMWGDQGFQSFPEINLDGLDLGFAPLPTGPDGTAVAPNSVTGYFISAQTTQREACWQWLKFLGEQPYLASFGNTVPARPGIAASADYATAVGAEKAAANRASIESVTEPSATLQMGTTASWLGTGFFWWQSYAYDQILNNDLSVEEALAEVQAKADAYRDCVITSDAFEDVNAQRTCLGEVDETVPSFFIEVDE